MSKFKERINFCFENLATPMGKTVDLAAIIPIFFAQQHFQVIRVFRALLIMRLLRFLDNRHFFFGSIKPIQLVIFRIIYVMVSIIFVSAGLIYYAEHEMNPEKFATFFDGVCFSALTLTTVGFGDITPVSDYGRIITMCIIISGIVFIPWQVRNLIAHFIDSISKVPLAGGGCGLDYHDRDATYCKYCERKIHHRQQIL